MNELCHFLSQKCFAFWKIGVKHVFLFRQQEGKCPFWVRERVCVKAAKSILFFLVMEGNFFSEKLGSLKERTEKLQICRREQKSQKYQTWLLVHHARSHWWLIKKQLSQTRKAVYKLLLSSWIGFYSSVRESLKLPWSWLHTMHFHFLASFNSSIVGWMKSFRFVFSSENPIKIKLTGLSFKSWLFYFRKRSKSYTLFFVSLYIGIRVMRFVLPSID